MTGHPHGLAKLRAAGELEELVPRLLLQSPHWRHGGWIWPLVSLSWHLCRGIVLASCPKAVNVYSRTENIDAHIIIFRGVHRRSTLRAQCSPEVKDAEARVIGISGSRWSWRPRVREGMWARAVTDLVHTSPRIHAL